MKKCFLFAAFLLVAAQVSIPLRAEETAGPSSPEMKQKAEKRIEKRMEALTKNLGLSADQQTAVKAALEAQRDKMADVRKETGEKKKAIRADTDKQITSVLNDQQKAKYEKMVSERKDKIKKSWSHKKGAKDSEY